MRSHIHYTLLAAMGLAGSLSSSGLGLLEGYRLMLQNDPTLQAARYEQAAGQEEVNLGRAGLLPQVAASISKSHVHGTVDAPAQVSSTEIAEQTNYLGYVSKSRSVNLRQPIFNLQSWYQYKQGKARAEYSNAVFDGKFKDAATRYLEAYLNVLLAQENIELSTKQIDALKGQLALAERAFKAGDGTVTDIDEAQARLDLAEALRIEAQSQLEINLKKLADLTGTAVPQKLQAPGATLQLEPPQPASAAAWFDLAREQNPQVRASRQAMDIAKREMQKARAQHLPTVDFIAQASKSEADTVSTLNQRYSTRSAGFQVNIPIFSGGYVSAKDSQAAARYAQAQSELDAATQQVDQDIATQYAGVVNGVRKVQALRQAVASSEKSLKSNKMGFLAGVRANIDILNAEQQLYQAKRDLAQATFTYLLSWITLKADAGVLSEEDIAAMDRAFKVSQVSVKT